MVGAAGIEPAIRDSVDLDQRRDPLAYIFEHARRSGAPHLGATFDPGQTADVVGEHDARDAVALGNRHLEQKALGPTCDRAGNAEAGPLVVGERTHHDCRTTPSLLVALGRIKVYPNDVAGVRRAKITRPRFRRAAPSRPRGGRSRAWCRQASPPICSGAASSASPPRP